MTQTPDIPPVIESHESEYRDSGIVSTVAIAGHPLHPLLVTFPIALLSSVFLTDVAYWFTGDSFWARASIWLIGAGFISGLVAAATGMSDFLRINRVRKRRAGWIHMIGNIALLALTLVNWLIRLGDNYTSAILPIGIIISTIVAGALAITGWYGAELIYRHKVAVIGYNSRHE
ncbi:DUF2231 domain-containing protein [Leptolyngbya ohadii]|uniref:DUF2231 domain-containing protein n=1 Tax=Leptolyngbya ohadii TaxID=1962290 RepID=UPI000B59AEF9|nr:DUF2231 domain-containing protein [Leptolyngbya ohadii]